MFEKGKVETKRERAVCADTCLQNESMTFYDINSGLLWFLEIGDCPAFARACG
jgi:hypothetical protein